MLALVAVLAVATVKPTAAVDVDHLYVADGNGTVRAWSRKTFEFDAPLTKQLNTSSLLAIARDGETLWGFDGTRVFTWDPQGARWEPMKSKAPKASCSAFAVVGGKPVGTCGPGVHRFTDGKYWSAPEFKDQIRGRGFGEAPHAIASSGNVLAIGTGFGEWGGHLWLLDVSTGAWSKFYDPLGNAVGIAKTDKGWLVAWSMSHMMAHTRVRLHGADAKEIVAGPRLDDRYLRALTRDGDVVFGIEQNALVELTPKLELEKIQPFTPVNYGPERDAVGVSPGIGAFLPIGGERYLLAPISGAPLLIGKGPSVPLKAPASDAGGR